MQQPAFVFDLRGTLMASPDAFRKPEFQKLGLSMPINMERMRNFDMGYTAAPGAREAFLAAGEEGQRYFLTNDARFYDKPQPLPERVLGGVSDALELGETPEEGDTILTGIPALPQASSEVAGKQDPHKLHGIQYLAEHHEGAIFYFEDDPGYAGSVREWAEAMGLSEKVVVLAMNADRDPEAWAKAWAQVEERLEEMRHENARRVR